MVDAVCNAGNAITVLDLLFGHAAGCRWVLSEPEALRDLSDFRSCDTPPFREPCQSLKHSLTLVFTQLRGERALAAPQMATFLKILGLQKLIEIEGDLRIINLGTDGDPRLPFDTDAFLPHLQRVSRLTMQDANPNMGLPPLFSGIGIGLSNVQQLDILSISGQGFASLEAFAGLKCVATGIAIARNSRLATLKGLQALDVIGYDGGPGTQLFISDNPMLAQGSDLAALSRVAGCQGSASGIARDPIWVNVPPCANPIVTWAMLCGYITAGTCPPQPPPPNPPPLPPQPSPPPAPPPLCPLPPLAGDLTPGRNPVVCTVGCTCVTAILSKQDMGQ